MGRSTGCATHRSALLAFAERSELGPGSPAAFAHLDGCRRCQADLAEIVLTVHAIRRTLAVARTADPPPDGWDRLRERVQRPVAAAWAARTSLAGVIVGAGSRRRAHRTDRQPPAIERPARAGSATRRSGRQHEGRAPQRGGSAEPTALRSGRPVGRLAGSRGRDLVRPRWARPVGGFRSRRHPAGTGRLTQPGRQSRPNSRRCRPTHRTSGHQAAGPGFRGRISASRAQLTPSGCVRIVPAAQGPQLTVRSSVRPPSSVPAAPPALAGELGEEAGDRKRRCGPRRIGSDRVKYPLGGPLMRNRLLGLLATTAIVFAACQGAATSPAATTAAPASRPLGLDRPVGHTGHRPRSTTRQLLYGFKLHAVHGHAGRQGHHRRMAGREPAQPLLLERVRQHRGHGGDHAGPADRVGGRPLDAVGLAEGPIPTRTT